MQDGRRLEVTPTALLGRTALAASTTFMAASITYPLDIIRKRLVVDVGSDPSSRQYNGRFKAAVQRIYAQEGLKGFYRFYSYDMVFRWAAAACSCSVHLGINSFLSVPEPEEHRP